MNRAYLILFLLLFGCKKETIQVDNTTALIGTYSFNPNYPPSWFLDGRSDKITSWLIFNTANITRIDNDYINIAFSQKGKAYINNNINYQYSIYFSNIKAKILTRNAQFDMIGKIDSIRPWFPNTDNLPVLGTGIFKVDTLFVHTNKVRILTGNSAFDFKFIKN